MCDLFLEMIKTLTISEKTMDEHFTVKNIALMQEMEKKGKSIILMTSHYASYEWSVSINNKLNLEKLSRLRNPQERQKLIDEENNLFERSIQILEDTFDEELALNQQKLDLARQKLEELVTGPYANIEKERIRLERKKKRVKTKLTEDQVKAKKAAVKKVLSNAAKTLAPIAALQASRILFNIITANKKIQLLVDNANEIIEAAVTRQDIDNARVVRNSVLSIINDSERKLESLRKTIKTLNTIISILNIVLRLIILVASFPKVGGIPIAILLKIEKLQRLLDSLSVILSIIQGLLDAKLNNLNRILFFEAQFLWV
jgi:hypothetical protein